MKTHHVFRLVSWSAIALLVGLALAASASAQVVVPFPPYRYAGSIDSSVRIEVTPKTAQVFVDGYYAGIVDDFDGTFQRLHVQPGQHEITIYEEGFRTVRQNVYLMPDKTFHIKMKMEPLSPGETPERAPTPTVPAGGQPAPLPGPRGSRGGATPPRPLPPTEQPPLPPPGEAGRARTGTLKIDVQPADADVLVDGQSWGSQGANGVTIDLPEGRHVVQVRKAGYVGYLTEIDVRAGQTTPLTVMLRTAPQ